MIFARDLRPGRTPHDFRSYDHLESLLLHAVAAFYMGRKKQNRVSKKIERNFILEHIRKCSWGTEIRTIGTIFRIEVALHIGIIFIFLYII